MPSVETSPDTVARGRPFREGLLTLDPPRLLGTRCTACGCASFPARTFCPSCRRGTVERAQLSPNGLVHSFTVVRQAPPGIDVPYTLAWVDLPEDRVRLMAQIVGIPSEAVTLDLPVVLELASFGTDENGTELLGFRFRVTEEVHQ